MPTARQKEIWPEDRPVNAEKDNRMVGAIIAGVLLAAIIIILIVVGRPLLEVAKDSETLEAYIESRGAAGVWIYMLLVILQIFAAVVPGGPFEIAGGFLYGPFRGALICDLAMTAGSTMVFLLSRHLGMRFVRLYFSEEQIQSVRFLHSSKRSTAFIFLLFLIPGTPKDLLSYVIGMTDMALPTWIFITGVGRFPSILLSSIGGYVLENRRYGLFVLILLIFAVLSVGGLWYYHRANVEEGEEIEKVSIHSRKDFVKFCRREWHRLFG